LDRVERSQNRAPDTVTEMNFGLRFAENGAPRVTRQTRTRVNIFENCYNSPVSKEPAVTCFEARFCAH